MKVVWTRQALSDLKSLRDYLHERSPRGMKTVRDRLMGLTDLLETHPMMGVETDDPTIRRLVATPYPYLIFYEVGERHIIIHAVRHAARRPVPVRPPR